MRITDGWGDHNDDLAKGMIFVVKVLDQIQ
jgi:hypothetical protein